MFAAYNINIVIAIDYYFVIRYSIKYFTWLTALEKPSDTKNKPRSVTIKI